MAIEETVAAGTIFGLDPKNSVISSWNSHSFLSFPVRLLCSETFLYFSSSFFHLFEHCSPVTFTEEVELNWSAIRFQATFFLTVFFYYFNTFGEQTLGKQYREDRYNAGKSQSKKVSCSMSCNCHLTDFKTLFETKPFMSCVRRVKYNFHFTRAGCVFSYVYFLLWCRMSGF